MTKEETNRLDPETEAQKKQLQARWRLPENQALLETVVAALQAGQAWAHLLQTLEEEENYYDRRDLRGAALAGRDLTNADFSEAELCFADLSNATLAGANLQNADLSYVNFSGANLRGASFAGNFLMGNIDFHKADLTGANLGHTTIAISDMTGANLTHAGLDHAKFTGVKMENAVLTGASTDKTTFREFAPEPASSMTLEEEWEAEKTKREESRGLLEARWLLPENAAALEKVIVALREGHPWAHLLAGLPKAEDDYEQGVLYEGRDLRGVSLAGINLAGANLGEAVLHFANLSGAALAGSEMSDTDLFCTDFSQADLRRANFGGSSLINWVSFAGADLTEADMSFTTLRNADLTGANLTQAHFGYAHLIDTTLSGAVWDRTDTDTTTFQQS